MANTIRLIRGALTGAALTTIAATGVYAGTAQPVRPPQPHPTRVQVLVAAHDCWTGPAPEDMAGRFPGHVVLSRGERPAVYSARLVGAALDAVFGAGRPGWRVYAFCR